jgi:hypothetical protein
VLTRLNTGDVVGLIDRTSRKEMIDNREAYWYYICRPDGVNGWVFGAYIEGADERFDLITKDLDNFVRQENGELLSPPSVVLNTEQSIIMLRELPLEMRCRIRSLFLSGDNIITLPDVSNLPHLVVFSAINVRSLRSIEGLRNSTVAGVRIHNTSVVDIIVLSTCKNLASILADNTMISTFPDLSTINPRKYNNQDFTV